MNNEHELISGMTSLPPVFRPSFYILVVAVASANKCDDGYFNVFLEFNPSNSSAVEESI
ncbi:MAG: hypothetical protein ACI90V_013124 [Bacillariaceae sp.]|jgi:hypothetical protein